MVEKTVKVAFLLISLYLFTSPSFISSVVFGQEIKATCDALRLEEAKKWPNIVYCSKPIDDNYFFYVSKPEDYPDFYLIGNVKEDEYWIESLNPPTAENPYPVAEWDENNEKIIVHRSGSFILHGKDNTLSFESSDAYVNVNGVEDCKRLVLQMTILAAQEYFMTSNATSNATNQLFLLGKGLMNAVGSMYPKLFLTHLPKDIKTEIIKFTQSAGLNEKSALIPYKDGKLLKIVDLKGTSERVGWKPAPESINIARAEWAKVQSGEYDGLYFIHTHPPSRELVDVYKKSGISLFHLTTPSAEDINAWQQISDLAFDGEYLPTLITGSASPEELYRGEIYATWYRLNPEKIPIDETKYEKVSFWEEGLKYRIDPRDIDLSGAITRLSSKVTPDGRIIISSDLDPNFAELLRYDKINRIQERLQSSLSDVDFIINQVYIGNLQANKGSAELQLYDRKLQSLNEIISGSDLSESDKNLYSTFVSRAREIMQDTVSSNFETWASYADGFGSLSLDLQVQTINTISGVSYIGEWNLKNGYRVAPYALDFANRAVETANYGVETQWGPILSYEYHVKVGDVLDEISPKLSNPLYETIVNYKGLIAGISLAFILSLGPYFEHYGRLEDNYILYHLGAVINYIGLGITIFQLAYLGFEVYSLVSLGVGASTILSFITNLAINYAIAFIIGLMINLSVAVLLPVIFFILFPPEHYPCELDKPRYDDDQVKLQENIVHVNDTLHYIYFGVRYCYPTEGESAVYTAVPFYADNPDITKKTILMPIGEKGWYDDYCDTLDGRCFNCSLKVTEPEPGQWYVDAIWFNYHSSGLYPFPDYQNPEPLLVCPTGKGLDESENKCVECDATTHTESSGSCEVGCNASKVCDEIDPFKVYSSGWSPGDIPSCDKAGNTYFQDSCSDCLAKDKDNVCRSPGSLAPQDGCTASHQCNGIAAGTSWCEENIRKTCDSTCTFSQECSPSCPDWNGDILCYGLEPGTGCCSGCYYVDINSDEKVNIIDVSEVAKAFGKVNPIKEDVNCDGVVNQADLQLCSKKDARCDIDEDGDVDIDDMAQLSKAVNTEWEYRKADLNDDCKVNIIDITLVARKFGQEC